MVALRVRAAEPCQGSEIPGRVVDPVPSQAICQGGLFPVDGQDAGRALPARMRLRGQPRPAVTVLVSGEAVQAHVDARSGT